MKVVIIGGVAAGMSAASKIKRSVKGAEVVVYERGKDLSYGACGLPYFVGDEIKERESLVIRRKPQFEKSGITVFDLHEVISVNTETKELRVKNIETGDEFTDTYDKLVIATGASPVRPSWPGADLKNVHVLSTLDDGESIKNNVMNDNIQNVVIVGAGFIGVELAENIRSQGKRVTVIEFQGQILSQMDSELSEILEEELSKKGVEIKTGEGVKELVGDGKVEGVITDKGEYKADMVILSVGVRPNTSMFVEGTIDKLRNGAIKVNKKMETSVKDIYAAGDCASVYHRGKDSYDEYIPLATNANKQGKLIGSIIAGEDVHFLGALGTSMIKVYDLEAAKTGLSEKEAKDLGIDYVTKTITSHNHAKYYPNPQDITVKIVADKTTHCLLGVQIVGHNGSALRINTAAVAVHAKLTTEEFGWIDFGYAQPFAPTWDALQVASNVIR